MITQAIEQFTGKLHYSIATDNLWLIINVYPSTFRLVKTPIGVSDRDFVQHMTHGSDEEGTKYILYKNAVHPSRPERKGIVRYCKNYKN